MADNKTPWGDALAPFQKDDKTTWIDLGPVWEGESGALQFTLVSEPFHWRAHNAERRIVIKKRDAGNNYRELDDARKKSGGRR